MDSRRKRFGRGSAIREKGWAWPDRLPFFFIALLRHISKGAAQLVDLGNISHGLFNLLVSFIFPVFIAPVFNKYTQLENPAIRKPILALARANQIPVDKVFVVDASRQTTRVSANVAGFLGTTRIALNDNLLKQVHAS